MTLSDLATALNSLGYPVAYSHFKTTQTPPFICYLVTNTESFVADNEVINEVINVDIELYVKTKSITIENEIKNLLNTNELPYEYDERSIKDEGVFQCVFSIQLI